MSKFFHFLKAKKKIIALIIYILLFVAEILLATLVLHYPVVAVCIIFVAEAVICACLYFLDFWIQGCVLMVELIAGVLALRIVLIALGIVVYLLSFALLKFLASR